MAGPPAPSEPSGGEARGDGSRSRSRWRRVLSKISGIFSRGAVGRRSKSNATPKEPMVPSAAAKAQHQDATLPPTTITTTTPSNEPHPVTAAATIDSRPEEPLPSSSPATHASITIIDTSAFTSDHPVNLEADDTAEPSLPMLTTRTGLSSERAQRLFEKYGIKYEPRGLGKEGDPIQDIRRVEKPIRVRIHYTCEDCGTSFGASRTCSQCGHRRCRDCPRNPARRVRDVLQEARAQQRELAQNTAAIEESRPTPVMEVPVAVTAVGSTAGEPSVAGAEQPPSTSPESQPSTQPTGINQYQYVVQHRPRKQMSLRPSSRVTRRTCHECQTHFDPANHSLCPSCRHNLCHLCPSERMTDETPEAKGSPAVLPPLVATVKRVYKKPRQRIRWTCDQCQAVFGERRACRACGHERCEGCTRSPPIRIPRPPDPEVVQSVEDKLAFHRHSSSPPIASSSRIPLAPATAAAAA